MFEKLKSFLANDSFFMAFLIVLVGIISFGLGRQSMIMNQVHLNSSAGVAFLDVPHHTSEAGLSETDQEIQVIGSRSGTKYHLPDCPGALQIKDENKIYFNSIELAEAAGYTPASNCPGL